MSNSPFRNRAVQLWCLMLTAGLLLAACDQAPTSPVLAGKRLSAAEKRRLDDTARMASQAGPPPPGARQN